MKIIVLSDSHNNYPVLRKIVTHYPQADLFIFLGDGLQEFEDIRTEFPKKEMWAVSGNCDTFSMEKSTATAWIRDVKVLYTHGQQWAVKAGLEHLKKKAKEEQVRLVLFGHTHAPFCEYEDEIYYFNPGSVSFARMGEETSYGIVDIEGKNILCHHAKVSALR